MSFGVHVEQLLPSLATFHFDSSTEAAFLSKARQPLLLIHGFSSARMSHPAGLIAIASILSLVLGLWPLLRRKWNRVETATRNGGKAVHKAPQKGKVDTGMEQAVDETTRASESYEEVTLSFGTDRPEVYMKMASQGSPRSVMQMPVLRELLVQ